MCVQFDTLSASEPVQYSAPDFDQGDGLMVYVFSHAQRHQYADAYNKMMQARAMQAEGWDSATSPFLARPQEDTFDREHNPLYIVSLNEQGEHSASMRVLPTTGPTMLRCDFQARFKPCPDIASSHVWECSCLCGIGDSISPAGRASTIDASKTLCRTALENGVQQIIGIYGKNMARLFRRIGWEPSTLAQTSEEDGELCLGLWDVSPLALRHMAERQAMPF